jgi:hypothetical protein
MESARLSQAKSNGEAFAAFDHNIRNYYKSMGYDVDQDVERLLDEATSYAVNPDSQKYLDSIEFRKFKHALLLTLLAAEYLDFENVVAKFDNEKDWPKKIAKYMIKDKRFTQYMEEDQLLQGLEAYNSSKLKLRDFTRIFQIKEYSNTMPDKKDLGLFAYISMGKPKDQSIEKFLRIKPSEGGLGVRSDEDEIDLAEAVYYGYFASDRFDEVGGLSIVFSALSQVMKTKSSRIVKAGHLLQILKSHSESEQNGAKHYISSGVESKTVGQKGVKSAKVFDKSSELKLKEEEIPFTDGQDGRKSERLVDLGAEVAKDIESSRSLTLERLLLVVLGACGVRIPSRLLNLSFSLEERIKSLIQESIGNADRNVLTSSEVKLVLDKRNVKSIFERILENNGLLKAPASQQNDLLTQDLHLNLLAGLPDVHSALKKVKKVEPIDL